MGVYLNCFWQPDSGGMNKAERMGGPYHPYLPYTLADYELLLSPSCGKRGGGCPGGSGEA